MKTNNTKPTSRQLLAEHDAKIEAVKQLKASDIKDAIMKHGENLIAIAWPDEWYWNATLPKEIEIGLI